MFMPNGESFYSLWLNDVHCCHRPANVIASGPGGVIRKNGRKLVKTRRVYPDGLVAIRRWRTAPVKWHVATSVARLPLMDVGLYRNGLSALSV